MNQVELDKFAYVIFTIEGELVATGPSNASEKEFLDYLVEDKSYICFYSFQNFMFSIGWNTKQNIGNFLKNHFKSSKYSLAATDKNQVNLYDIYEEIILQHPEYKTSVKSARTT